jgi:general L-amino acid transport system permease protein
VPSAKISARAWALQAGVLAALVALAAWFAANTQANLAARGLSAGYGFLGEAAGFAITEGPVPYESGDSYLKAFAAGAANTLVAAAPAIALATLLGFALGVAALARSALLRGAVRLYVDAARNIPLLVHVLVWYAVLTNSLPDTAQPLSLGPVFLSKMGLAFPHPLSGEIPSLGPFGVTGGLHVSPELAALVLALTGYSCAYCAEIVRAGLLAVPRGQWEAAHALGLGRAAAMRLVIGPQALRVILPPYISLALNTIKNSSLGVAIGYPELVSIGTTSLSQSGRAIECISVIAGVYLVLNLLTSLLLGVCNRRVQIKER